MSNPRSREGYRDEQDGSDDGSGTHIGSPVLGKDVDEEAANLHPSGYKRSEPTKGEKLQLILLAISFTLSGFLLYLTVSTSSQTNSMLSKLQIYAVDVANVTNKTWGYGEMPVKVNSGGESPVGHDHGMQGGSKTTTALDSEDTAILYGNVWQNAQGSFPISIFPTTSDTLDEQRPDEVVTYERNFLVKKHVSSVIQYNRRISSNETYRSSHTTCSVQAFMPPFQSLANNKTLLTSNTPLDLWLLETPPDGPWWAGKDFIKNGNYTLRSNMTWNSKPSRKQKLGTIHAWPGMNTFTKQNFECPPITGRKGERIAVEYACTPGPEVESCFLSFDARMVYPILLFEVVY